MALCASNKWRGSEGAMAKGDPFFAAMVWSLFAVVADNVKSSTVNDKG